MLKDILFCVNSVLPVFIMIAVGYFLRRINLLTDAFVSAGDKLVFKCALPAMLFYNVATSEFSTSFDSKLTSFCILGIISVFLLMTAIITPSIKRRDVRGAVIQGIYRSNFAILGVPLAENLFPGKGSTEASLLLPFVIPIYNIFAVVILAMNMPQNEKKSKLSVFLGILKNIVTNPLIISVILALPFSFGIVTMPTLLDKSVSYLADLSTPLALLSLGASFKFSDLKGNIGYSMLATVLKIVVCPAVFCTLAILLGFKGIRLGMVLIVFGAPTAVSSYIMAKQMKSNSVIASQIIVLSTMLCSLTLLCGSFILKFYELI